MAVDYAAVDKDSAARNFEENGFVILPGLLEEPEVAALSQEIDRIVSGEAVDLPPDLVIYEPGTSPPRVRNAFHIHQYHSYFMKVASHPQIVEFIGRILGFPIRLYSSSLFAATGPRIGSPYWENVNEPTLSLSQFVSLRDDN